MLYVSRSARVDLDLAGNLQPMQLVVYLENFTKNKRGHNPRFILENTVYF